MSYLVNINKVSKKYTQGGLDFYALKNVDFVVEKGDFWSIVGPSGSGKSTLMNIIGLLDRPTSGSYQFNRKNIKLLSNNKLAKIRNEEIGFVFQQFFLLPEYNAVENVALPLLYRNLSPDKAQAAAKKVLAKLGLKDKLFSKPNELSGGQQQRVAIARAIVGKPSLLLADEPTGSLDSSTGAEILNIFKELQAEGTTIVLITHDHNIAKQTDKILHINDGAIKAI